MEKHLFSEYLFDQTKDLIWAVDKNLDLVYANMSYLDLMKVVTGIEKELNTPILVESFGEGYIDKWKAYYRKALTGEFFEIEEHFYNPETQEMEYGHVSFSPIRGEGDEILTVACRSTDITSVIRQKDYASRLMDASLDIFCTIDEDGKFVFVSAVSAKHWGYAPEELIGKAYRNLILKEDLEKTDQVAAEIMAGKEFKSFSNRFQKKNGDIAHNLWSARWDVKSKMMYCVARDAREAIEQKQLLVQSEERFKALVQEGADLIAILDRGGNYTYVSPTSTSILGIAPEAFIGKNAFEFIHSDDAEKTLQFLQKIKDEKTLKVEPFRFQNSTGEWRWIETVLTNMLDNPTVKGIVANSRDVTEKMIIQRQLEANELFNRTLLESSPDCLKVIDAEGRIQYMNFNGLSLMETEDFSKFQNREWWTLWGKENEVLIKNSVEKALHGETVEFTAFCPTAKGTPKWWNIIVAPVQNSGGPIQLLAVSRDITEKKQEEQQLKLLSSVITNTNDAVLITEAEPFDEPGPRIIYVNEAFTKITGYTAEEIIGKSPRILQGPKSNKEELAKLGKALRNWEPYEITTVNYKKNGEEFWINFTVTPVADENGWYTHWIAVERDVTEQKNTELEKTLLAQIGTCFSEEELSGAGEELCRVIRDFGDFDLIELWCPNLEQTHVFRAAAETALKEFDTDNSSISEIKTGEGLPGKVWKQKKQLLWNRDEISKYFLRNNEAEHAGLKYLLGVPLTHQNQVTGIMVIGTTQDVISLSKFSDLIQKLETFIGSEINRKRLESDLSHLYQAIPDILCITDFNGRFLKINPAGCELLGYKEEEILFHSFDEFVHPEDMNISSREVKNLETGGSTIKFENRYITKDSKIIWLSWSCNSSIHEGLIYASAKNITREVRLRELNKQAGSMAKIGSWEVDLEKNTVFWSEIVHQLHETDPNTFFPDLDTSINFYRKDFWPLVQDSFEKSISTGAGFDFEAVIITQKLNERWVRVIGNVEFANGIAKRIFGSFQDITDRKESENRLQASLKSLEDYKFALDQTAIITITDIKGVITYVNEQFCKISKYSREELIGNTHSIINSKYHPKSFFAELWGTIAKGKVFRAEIKNQAKDGSYYWVDSTIVPFLDENNKPFQYVAIRIDITAKKMANEKIIESLDEKHQILESIGDNFLTLNKDWIVTYWNRQAETFSGIKKEDILGKDIREVYSDAIDGEFQRNYQKAMSTGEIVNFEFHYTPYDKWVEVMVYPSPSGLSIYSRDITARKNADILLLKANERFEIVTEATNDAIWDWDIQNNTQYWGKGFKKLFGYELEDVSTSLSSWMERVHKEDLDKVTQSLDKTLESSTDNWVSEYRYLKADGTYAVVIDRGIAIRNTNGKPIRMIGAMTDITEQKAQEEHLISLNESLKTYAIELERSNEELEQFAFVTSHDLQEPLRMISSFMDLLRKKYAHQLDPKAHQYIDFAIDGAKRMKQIILDLLLYSRANKPSEELQKVDLNELVSEYSQLRRKLIAEKNAVILHGSLPILETYRAPITQVIHCLLDNALRYVKENEPPYIEIHAKEKETHWEFSVKDNGIGIDKMFYEKIFVIFQRLHNRNQLDGTGIGLSIAKRSVEFLGGKIWLDSTVGEGSTFYFTIAK